MIYFCYLLNEEGNDKMAKKRTSKPKTTKTGEKSKPTNKAALLREFLREEPKLSFQDAIKKFDARGMRLTSAQFYSIRGEMQKKTGSKSKPAKPAAAKKRARTRITPAKPPVVSSAKSAPCTLDLKTSSEIYDEPELMQDASTRPPNVERTLQARNLIEQAYLEAWQLVGQNYDLVNIIVDDVQQKHSLR